MRETGLSGILYSQSISAHTTPQCDAWIIIFDKGQQATDNTHCAPHSYHITALWQAVVGTPWRRARRSCDRRAATWSPPGRRPALPRLLPGSRRPRRDVWPGRWCGEAVPPRVVDSSARMRPRVAQSNGQVCAVTHWVLLLSRGSLHVCAVPGLSSAARLQEEGRTSSSWSRKVSCRRIRGRRSEAGPALSLQAPLSRPVKQHHVGDVLLPCFLLLNARVSRGTRPLRPRAPSAAPRWPARSRALRVARSMRASPPSGSAGRPPRTAGAGSREGSSCPGSDRGQIDG
eukprot:scaffold15316_cov69-Phaeocystis_antarctica.AAC.5